MNKLKTTDVGGFPLDLDDLRWFLDSITDAFKGVLSTHNSTNGGVYILDGCEPSTVGIPVTDIDIASGYISIDGEVCFVPNHQIPIQAAVGQDYYWYIDSSFDALGLELFQDGNQHDTYEVRVGKINFGVVPAGRITAINTSADRFIKNIKELYADYIATNLGGLNEQSLEVGTAGVPFLNAWTYDSSSSYNPLSFFKDVNGMVHIQGQCQNATTFNTAIFNLPAGYRPTKRISVSATLIDSALDSFPVRLEIQPSGDVFIFILSGLTAPAAGGVIIHCTTSFRPI